MLGAIKRYMNKQVPARELDETVFFKRVLC